jgi:hypothetical protein
MCKLPYVLVKSSRGAGWWGFSRVDDVVTCVYQLLAYLFDDTPCFVACISKLKNSGFNSLAGLHTQGASWMCLHFNMHL